MNTGQLKRFAQEARRKLIQQVGAKLDFVLTTDSAELREKVQQVKQLREALAIFSKEQLVEKVAYTWFNRLMALRFLDANDYQPLGIRVITPKDGYTTPELLDEVKRGSIPSDLKVNRQRVNDLLDAKIPSTNPQNEAFKELLIAACNHLHTTFPFLFEKIDDYSELLLPDDLTSDFSIVTDVRNGMPVDDCKNVEIIGWIYQFYISEKKDEVFASKAKVKKEDIPAATQLFTPRWIVEYMVQNTLGKLWLQNRPNSKLREHMPYFIESESLKAEDFLKISSPEEIRLADPASGSGHILVYAFELFTKIYEEEGYNTTDIPKLIIEKNLYGFEIDQRAAQLSALALMVKAREFNRRAFRRDIKPNILCYEDLNLNTDDIKVILNTLKIKVSDELLHDLRLMQQATNFGSLIIPHADISELTTVYEKLIQTAYSSDVFIKPKIDALLIALNQLLTLDRKFHCVVANPPYMGSGNMNVELLEWIRYNYPISKSDLFSCFISRVFTLLFNNGFIGMITMESWMFLSSFEEQRDQLLNKSLITTLIHMPYLGKGGTSLGINFGTCAFVLKLIQKPTLEEGFYQCIRYFETDDEGKPLRFPTINEKFNTIHQNNFRKIPSSPISYWLGQKWISIFSHEKVEDFAETRLGMATADNNRFLRFHWEVNKNKISFNSQSRQDSFKNKWFPYAKGGDFRKWYGNLDYVVNWGNDGNEIQTFTDKNGKVRSHNYNLDYIFRKGITWSALTSAKTSFRILENSLFDNAGSSLFTDSKEHLITLIGLLNSKISESLLPVINPTLNYQPGTISKIPVIIESGERTYCCCESLIDTHKIDWDTYETSWHFEKHGLIKIKKGYEIEFEECFDFYIQFRKNMFFQTHQNEEELNHLFIEIYGLQDELTPDVPLEDITILQDELDRKALAKLNKKLVRNPETLAVTNYHEIELPFIANEVLEQFISYSVGCMFGRYSLDKEGLILANQGETLQDYISKIGKSVSECTFLPDDDNIIPILEDEWFDDDIVGRFFTFLKVTFGEKNFNKNLAFIEEQIGMDMRRYFTKNFYADHVQRYKKRPIYWMFSSPKGSFNALIYMHRYTPDTVSNILNKYLKEFIGKLKTRKEHLQHIQVQGSPAEKTKAIKESDAIDKMLLELHEYERDTLYPLATQRIAIDLDDGVLVNYNKFGKAIKEIAGLNDKKTKDKVREFDWIDVTQIR